MYTYTRKQKNVQVIHGECDHVPSGVLHEQLRERDLCGSRSKEAKTEPV